MSTIDEKQVLGLGKELKGISHLEYYRDKKITLTTYKLLTDFKNMARLYFKFMGLHEPLTSTQKEICDYLQYGYSSNYETIPEKEITYNAVVDGMLKSGLKVKVPDFKQRIIINGYRGMAKSFITTAYTAWRLFRNPQEKILVVSATSDRAKTFINSLKQFIHTQISLHFLKPKRDDTSTTEHFNVAPARKGGQSYSVKAIGVFGTVTGFRATLVIYDDVEVESTSLSPTKRERLSERVKEFENLIEGDEKSKIYGPRIIVLGTPQNQDSIYMKLPSRGYDKRIWTARYPTDKQFQTLEKYLAPNLKHDIEKKPELLDEKYGKSGSYGRPIDNRYGEEELLSREISVGSIAFNLQYMMDVTTNISDFPFRLSDFIIDDFDSISAFTNYKHSTMDEYRLEELQEYNPSILPTDCFYKYSSKSQTQKEYEYKIMALDPAGKGKDETAYTILGVIDGFIYIIDIGGFKGDGAFSKDNLSKVIDIAYKHEVDNILIETNSIGQAMPILLTDYIDNIVRKNPSLKQIGVEEIYHNTMSKEKRIMKYLAPIHQGNKIVLNKKIVVNDLASCIENYASEVGEETAIHYSFLYQITRFRYDPSKVKNESLPFDDRLDVLATGVEHLEEQVAKIEEKLHKQREFEEFERMEEEARRLQDTNLSIKVGDNGVSQYGDNGSSETGIEYNNNSLLDDFFDNDDF